MKAITIRNIPPKVARAIRLKAQREHVSLNKAVISLLQERLGAGNGDAAPIRHHDLDFMLGSWTKEEADEFDQALADQRTIDPELWK